MEDILNIFICSSWAHYRTNSSEQLCHHFKRSLSVHKSNITLAPLSHIGTGFVNMSVLTSFSPFSGIRFSVRTTLPTLPLAYQSNHMILVSADICFISGTQSIMIVYITYLLVILTRSYVSDSKFHCC